MEGSSQTTASVQLHPLHSNLQIDTITMGAKLSNATPSLSLLKHGLESERDENKAQYIFPFKDNRLEGDFFPCSPTMWRRYQDLHSRKDSLVVTNKRLRRFAKQPQDLENELGFMETLIHEKVYMRETLLFMEQLMKAGESFEQALSSIKPPSDTLLAVREAQIKAHQQELAHGTAECLRNEQTLKQELADRDILVSRVDDQIEKLEMEMNCVMNYLSIARSSHSVQYAVQRCRELPSYEQLDRLYFQERNHVLLTSEEAGMLEEVLPKLEAIDLENSMLQAHKAWYEKNLPRAERVRGRLQRAEKELQKSQKRFREEYACEYNTVETTTYAKLMANRATFWHQRQKAVQVQQGMERLAHRQLCLAQAHASESEDFESEIAVRIRFATILKKQLSSAKKCF